MGKELLSLFAVAIGGAALVVTFVQIVVRIFFSNAYRKPPIYVANLLTHDVVAPKRLSVEKTIIFEPARSARSATDPIFGDSQAGFRSEIEKGEHWSTRLVPQK